MSSLSEPSAAPAGAPPPAPAPAGPASAGQDGRVPYPVQGAPQQDRITAFFHRLWYRSPVWAAPVAMLACMGGAAGYTLAAHPADAAAGAAPTCLLKYTTGFDCPGCGGTRAAWYLLHGDVPAAARHHALFTFAVPFLLYLYVAWAGRRMFGWKLPQLDLGPRVLGAFMAAWAVFSVLRNLPWAPFTEFYV
jgi:Protein of unknown function (DUF2752)